jgi:ketosteroid isomerase-like protein
VTPRQLMTDYLAAAQRADWDKASAYFAYDIVDHPRPLPVRRDRQGKDAAVEYIQTIRDHYRDGEIELELIDMPTSDDRVALLVRERLHGDGPAVEIRRANVYRVQRDQIVEVSIFEADQYAVDTLVHETRPRI